MLIVGGKERMKGQWLRSSDDEVPLVVDEPSMGVEDEQDQKGRHQRNQMKSQPGARSEANSLRE
jgi:hypothetical protein